MDLYVFDTKIINFTHFVYQELDGGCGHLLEHERLLQ